MQAHSVPEEIECCNSECDSDAPPQPPCSFVLSEISITCYTLVLHIIHFIQFAKQYLIITWQPSC